MSQNVKPMFKETITKAEFEELSKVMEPIEIIKLYSISQLDKYQKITNKDINVNVKFTKQSILDRFKSNLKKILISFLALITITTGIYVYKLDQELTKFETIPNETFKNGFMKVKKNKKFGIINENKKLITNEDFENVEWEYDYFIVKQFERYNYLDYNGKLIFDQWYDSISILPNGIRKVKKNNLFNVIDFSNKIFLSEWVEDLSNYDGKFILLYKNKLGNLFHFDKGILSTQWLDISKVIILHGGRFGVIYTNEQINLYKENGDLASVKIDLDSNINSPEYYNQDKYKLIIKSEGKYGTYNLKDDNWYIRPK